MLDLLPLLTPQYPFWFFPGLQRMKTEFAFDSVRIGCGTGGQTEHLPGFGVNQFDSVPAPVRIIPDAGWANPYAGGNAVQDVAAQKAFSPFFG